METVQSIKQEIKDLKREMKALGIKKVSCFNGGLDRTVYQFNVRLFELNTKLERALKVG